MGCLPQMVFFLGEVPLEPVGVLRLDDAHRRPIERLDGRVEGCAVLFALPRRVSEAAAPVAKIGGDDEEVGRVVEEGREDVAESRLGGGGERADHDGDERRWAARARLEHLAYVWEVHLETVLGLVDADVHVDELAGRAELVVGVAVDAEVADGGAVDVADAEGAPAQEDVVGGTEEEHAGHLVRIHVRVAPGGGGTGVGVPGVGDDKRPRGAGMLARRGEVGVELAGQRRAVRGVPRAGVGWFPHALTHVGG